MIELLCYSSIIILAVLLVRGMFFKYVRARILYALWLLPIMQLLFFWLPCFQSEYTLMRQIYPEFYEVATEQLNRVFLQSNNTLLMGEQPINKLESLFGSGLPLWRILVVIWFCGAVITVILTMVPYLRLQKYIKKNMVLPSDDTQEKKVYFVRYLPSPCMIAGNIYIDIAQQDNKERLRYIIQHEKTHRKQGDPVWNLIRVLCVSLYWFNPLVWVAAFVSKADSEYACDERIVQGMQKDEKCQYGKSLFELAVNKGDYAKAGLWSSGINDGNLKSRIKRIFYMDGRIRIVSSLMFILVSLVLSAGVFLTIKHGAIPLMETRKSVQVQEYLKLETTDSIRVQEANYHDGTLSVRLFSETDDVYEVYDKWLAYRTDEQFHIVKRKNLQTDKVKYLVGGAGTIKQFTGEPGKQKIAYLEQSDNDIMWLVDSLTEEFNDNYKVLEAGNYRMTYVLCDMNEEQRELLLVDFIVD